MSFVPSTFRPFARGGWGGNAASHFRGVLCLDAREFGMQNEDPQVLGVCGRGQIGTVIYRSAGAWANLALVGVSRDSAGAVLGLCRLELYSTADDTPQATTNSDASGNFRFNILPPGPYYIVAYKAGSPDAAGTTVNTLQPT